MSPSIEAAERRLNL